MLQLIDNLVVYLANLAPPDTWLNQPQIVKGLLAVVLVCFVCGAVGSQVVANRMAFFSDALAHCAFAGIGLALLVGLVARLGRDSEFYRWGVPLIMVLFGVLIGIGIAFVRERTGLASDTVIGVFFAGAIGFGAMLLQALHTRAYLSPEAFLFGDPIFVSPSDLFMLIVLALVTAAVLMWIYNGLVFTSFNPSLARSRRISMRLYNYVFIILLALIVNLTLKTVGVLLINALLVVPAATAANLSRNMRQMFWLSIALALGAGLLGAWIATDFGLPDPATGQTIHFGWAGTIVVVSVLLFFGSMILQPVIKAKGIARTRAATPA
ncbi:MAG: metal ABC transporter permease [Gemmataceae bacterium]